MTKPTIHSKIVPVVGMGCTIHYFSDREAATVIEIKSPKTVIIQVDKCTRTDKNGMSDDQSYTYEPNPSGAIFEVRLTSKGVWKILKESSTVTFGVRRKYHDFTF